MSFWGEKIQQQLPPQPAQPPAPERAVAPGAWWQQGEPVPARQQAVPFQQAAHAYAPAEAEVVGSVERCPRCGSEDYATIVVDTSSGGATPLLAQSGGRVKQCFTCRYPAVNATGSMVSKGSSAVIPSGKVSSLRVRQAGDPGQGSWGDNSWDNAVLIV